MKKKLSTIITVSILTLSLTGCNGGDSNSTTAATTATTTEATTSITTTEEAITESSTESDAASGTIADLAQYLVDQGVVSGEQSETMYSYIGAIDGFKYLDSDVEVYEYDTSSDTYKEIVNTNSVSGLTVSAINGPYILIFSNGNVNQTVIDSFNSFK